tara:strand:- start:211 stop:468 length:258 start_codon:yes stop_codon:yes gene_type:complete
MKKLLISVGAFILMSSTINKTNYPSDQLCFAMLNVSELKDWIWDDLQSGKISQEQAENYSELLDETFVFIEDYYKHLPNNIISNK